MLGPIVLMISLTQAASTVLLAAPVGPTPQAPAAAVQATPEQPWPPAGVSRIGAGVTAPRPIKEVKPGYSAEARRAKIQGIVVMEAVVKPDGTVGEVRVTRSLDRVFGLDDEAVKTMKKWRFTPGKKDGVAVPVVVEVEMTFTLR